VLVGIKNLYITYKDDSTACAGLDYINELIEDFIVRHDLNYQRETITTILEEEEERIATARVVSHDDVNLIEEEVTLDD